MQNNFYFLFITSLFFGCSNNPNEVTVTSENDTNGSHMSPGYVFFEKGNNIDTMELGSWGFAPVHKQFKLNDRDYVAFVFSYLDMGDNENRLSIMSLNEDNYLTAVFDTLISDEQISSFKINRRNLEFIVPNTLLIHHHIETYNHSDEGSKKTDSKKEVVLLNLAPV